MRWKLMLAALLSTLVTADYAPAKNDIDEKKKEVEDKGGKVIWGKHFDHLEYAIAAAHIAAGQGGKYLADKVNEVFTDFGIKLGMEALNRLVKGETLNVGDLEIQGGVATYNHSRKTLHHEPRVRWEGIKSKVEMVPVEHEFPEPNTHQLYLRIVDKKKPKAQPVGVESRVAIDANGGRGGPYLNSNLEPNDNHIFSLEQRGDYYRIIPRVASVAMDANGGNGGPYWNNNLADNDNHLFRLEQVGAHYMIVPKVKPGAALDANAGKGGPYWHEKRDAGNPNHLWALEDAPGGGKRIVSVVTVKK